MNVRITVNKALNNGAIIRPPNQNRSINRLGKRTRKDQIPTAVGFPSEREVRLPERSAPSYIVVNQCVLQQVVTHAESVIQPARKNASTGTVSLGRSRRRFTCRGLRDGRMNAALIRRDNQPSWCRAGEIVNPEAVAGSRLQLDQ